MKVLVTGHRGYLGRVLVPILEAAGHEVEGCDSGLYEPDFRPVRDVRAFQVPKDIEAVVHLAAIVGEPACRTYRQLAEDINVNGTANILSHTKNLGIPLIFASTCSVYGAANHILFESDETKPLGAYASQRLSAEHRVREAGGTALRFGTLFGWSPRMRFDLVLNKWAGEASQGKPINVEGGGQWRPFCHVQDAALAIHVALETAKTDPETVRGEVFNVAAINSTLLEAANSIRKATACDVQVNQKVTDMRNYRVSSDLIHSIGWKHSWTIQAGVEDIIEHLRGDQSIDINAPDHSNIEYLKRLFP